MAAIAQNLPTVEARKRARKGPLPSCGVYGTGDLDDFAAIHARRAQPGETWATVQAATEEASGLPRIKGDHFRYHWWGKCAHWDHVRDEIDAKRADMLEGRA